MNGHPFIHRPHGCSVPCNPQDNDSRKRKSTSPTSIPGPPQKVQKSAISVAVAIALLFILQDIPWKHISSMKDPIVNDSSVSEEFCHNCHVKLAAHAFQDSSRTHLYFCNQCNHGQNNRQHILINSVDEFFTVPMPAGQPPDTQLFNLLNCLPRDSQGVPHVPESNPADVPLRAQVHEGGGPSQREVRPDHGHEEETGLIDWGQLSADQDASARAAQAKSAKDRKLAKAQKNRAQNEAKKAARAANGAKGERRRNGEKGKGGGARSRKRKAPDTSASTEEDEGEGGMSEHNSSSQSAGDEDLEEDEEGGGGREGGEGGQGGVGEGMGQTGKRSSNRQQERRHRQGLA